ncbi:SH3 domain-containing protein [Streptomyces sp. NPDC087307]|uniref:SH3 domain-containing protein n=1 Tax=Streptomyces sp. NPDC087307 TaxID=3365782 RepID=UPI0037F5C0EE
MMGLITGRLRIGAMAAVLAVVLMSGSAPARAAAPASVPASLVSQKAKPAALRPGFIVSANGLRLRTGPRTSAPVRGLLYHGAGLLEYGWGKQRGSWRRVKVMRTGAVGFVWRGYIVRAHFER